MWFFTILMVVILVFMGIITGLTPFYSRKATPFGVAVTGKHTFVETRKKALCRMEYPFEFFN